MKVNAKHALCFMGIGAAAGAAIALLYAPKTGEKTRKDLRRFSRKTVDRLDDLQSEIRDQVGHLVEDVNDQLMGALDSAKKVVEEGRSRVARIMP